MCQDCERLYEQLQVNEHEMYVLRRAISNLRKDLKGERRKNEHLRRNKDKQFIRKGQKRGHYGRKG